jgi:hypothetical protein
MNAGRDRWIRWTTTGCVALSALIAGTVSYLHMHAGGVARAAGPFQVRVRWKEIWRACKICHSRSHPIRTTRAEFPVS